MTVRKLTKVQTAAQTFDMIANHLIAQRKPALNNSVCVYRANDGKMCAIGCIIPDSLYHEELEDKTFELLMVRQEDEKAFVTYFDTIHPSLMNERGTIEPTRLGVRLQQFHDSKIDGMEQYTTKRDLIRALRRIAREYKIKTTIPKG